MSNPKSLENLNRFDQMDTAKHRELSSKGGKASGIARRKKRARAKMLDAILTYGDFFDTFMELIEMSREELNRLLPLEELQSETQEREEGNPSGRGAVDI